MNKNRWVFALILLLLASFACNFLTGAKKDAPAVEQAAPTQALENQEPLEIPTLPEPEAVATDVQKLPDLSGSDVKTEFPLPADVSDVMDLGNGGINFQTKISIKDAIAFYRENFSKQGYKEREINAAITDLTFSLVFDGHTSGKAIVVQGVDLGSGSININIRFESL